MPRTVLPSTPATVLQPTGPSSGTALNPTFTAADTVNGNYFTASGRDLVTVYNSDSSPHNLTIFSAPDACTGRKADVVDYVVPAGGFSEFLVLPSSVFTQTDGTVQLSADNALVKFLVRSL
jgi:hypothetical protein